MLESFIRLKLNKLNIDTSLEVNWELFIVYNSELEEIRKIIKLKEIELLSNTYTNSYSTLIFKCKNNHMFEAQPNKMKQGRGCPYCAGKRVCKDNCVAIKYPELLNEYHPTKNGNLTLYDVTPGSDKIFWWICSKCNYEWSTRIKQRCLRGAGCHKCGIKKSMISRKNNLLLKLQESKPHARK